MAVDPKVKCPVRSLLLLLPLLLSACVSEQGGLDLFPLYRNQQEEDRGEFSILYPLSNFEWDEEGEVSWTVPFHVHWRRGETEEVTMVPALPLYFHQKSLDVESTGLFPLFARTQAGGRTDTTLLVLLADWASYVGEEGLAALSVFPLFQWREEGAGERFSLLRALELGPTGAAVSLLDVDRTGLSYGDGEDQPALAVDFASVFGRIVSLFHYDDEGSHTDTRLLTLFANEDWSLYQRRTPHPGAPGADTARTILFPFYWDIQHDAATHTQVMWPFYGATSRDDQPITRYILFPLLKLTDDPEHDVSGFDFIWPLIGRETRGGTSQSWFRPLYHYAGFENGYEWTILLNMFGYGVNGDRSRLRLFWIPWEL